MTFLFPKLSDPDKDDNPSIYSFDLGGTDAFVEFAYPKLKVFPTLLNGA